VGVSVARVFSALKKAGSSTAHELHFMKLMLRSE
jgi:hypothetical protein